MTTLICNTGPLIALAKIQKMALLDELGLENILIPSRVQKELLGKIGEETDLIESALNSFIQVQKREKASEAIFLLKENLKKLPGKKQNSNVDLILCRFQNKEKK